MNNDTIGAYKARLRAVAPTEAARDAVRGAGTSRDPTGPLPWRPPDDFLPIAAIIVGGIVFYFWKRKKK